MSWSYIPLTEGISDWSLQDVFKEINLATAERAYATGQCVWPPPSFQWKSGTVSSVTNTTIPTGLTFCGGTDDVSGLSYAVPWICNRTNPEVPTNWTLVIDDDDFTKVVKVTISSWTNTGVISFPSIADYVTSKQIPSLASLVGKKWYIIGFQAIWSSDRVIEWVNDYEWCTGIVVSSTNDKDKDGNSVPDSPSKILIRDKTQNWAINALNGKELLVYGDDGLLHRIAILKTSTLTANDVNTIYFPANFGASWKPAVGSSYVVVNTNGRAYPGRSVNYPLAWHRGHMNSYFSHNPNDQLGSAQLPATNIKIPVTGMSGCEYTDVPIFMIDLYTSYPRFDTCQPSDHYYNHNLYKSASGLQNAIEGLSFSFTFGVSGRSIPNINSAEMFSAAGINSYSGTTGSVEAVSAGGSNNAIAISGVSAPYYPIQVHYSIHLHDGSFLGGRGVLTAGRLLDEDSGTPFLQSDLTTTPPTYGADGKTVVISLGWTRYVPREFKRMYDQDYVFIPDILVDGSGIPSAADPALVQTTGDCFGVGRYVKRVKSTKYINRKPEIQNWKTAFGAAWENGDDFVTGDYARYVGDNFFDPTVTSSTGSESWSQFDVSVQAPYYEHFYNGTLNNVNQNHVLSQKSGISTDGSNTTIVDSTMDWYDHGWAGGVMRTEEGTSDGGSTTTLSDSSKASGDPNCFWATTRFGGDNPYIGWTVEVDFDDGNGNTVTVKRRITSSNPTAVSVSWSEPMPHSASGKVYRIKEPYILNRWKGRSVKVTKPDSTFVNATILGNSDDTLYFADIGFVVGGMTYEIIDPEVGGVWKWDGSKWVVPSGVDVQRMGVEVPYNFHKNQKENLPTIVKRYGKYTLGDYVQPQIFSEMKSTLQVLKKTKVGIGWDAASSAGGTPDLNYKLGGCQGTRTNFSDERDHGKALYSGATATTSASAPFVVVEADDYGDPNCTGYTIDRQYAYPFTTSTCDRRSFSVDYYVYAEAWGVTSGNYQVTFNAEGDPVLQDSWSLACSSAGGFTTGPVYGPKVGSLSIPSDVGDPPWPATVQKVEGYHITNAAAILTWTFNYV